jgi:hypothetical protein
MTDQQRSTGYRGSLPPARDRLARPWVIIVIGLFVLVFVLSFLGFPSALIPEATPRPLPSFSPGASVPAASGLPSASGALESDGSVAPSASPSE